MPPRLSALETVSRLFFPELCLGCRRLLRRSQKFPLCSKCLPELEPLPEEQRTIDGFSARFAFHGPLARAITALKHSGDWAFAGPIGRLMSESNIFLLNPNDCQRWDILIPVPLHFSRLVYRGYNQAMLLARAMLRYQSTFEKSKLPQIAGSTLVRCRATRPQQDLCASERWTNVRNAFSVAHPSSIRGKSILLVDDVTTTGATLSACRSVLQEHGARSVGGITLLRTLHLP